MSDTTVGVDSVVIAHRAGDLRRAFFSWDRARSWRDAVTDDSVRDYTLTEVLFVDDRGHGERLRGAADIIDRVAETVPEGDFDEEAIAEAET